MKSKCFSFSFSFSFFFSSIFKRLLYYFRIAALNHFDAERTRRETALNNLEAFVIDAQQKIASEEYKAAGSTNEIENILNECSGIQEWLYDDGFDATADVYEKKLASINELTADLYDRVSEHRERPDVLKGMSSMISGSTLFLNNMKNFSDTDEIFTKVEIETLERIINETQVLAKFNSTFVTIFFQFVHETQ